MIKTKKVSINKFFTQYRATQLALLLVVVGGVAGGLSYRSIHLKSSAQSPYSVTGYRIYGSADTPFPDGVGATALGGLSTASNPFSFGTSGGDQTITSSSSITYNGIKYNFNHSRLCYSNDVPRCPGGPTISYSQPAYISNPGSYTDIWFSYEAEKPAVVVQANGYQGSIIVAYNSALTISWGVSNASSCSAGGNWSGSKSVSGGSENHNGDTGSSGSKTYSLTCQGPGGSTTSSVNVTVQAPPPTQPPPTPPTTTTPPTTSPPASTTTPRPSSTPTSSAPKPTPALQGGTNRSTVVTAPAAPDTIPPSPPPQLNAVPNQEGTNIEVSWQAATDNIGVQSYQLERSTDEQSWIVISSGRNDTVYNDQDIHFQTRYFYRVLAVDAAGNKSGYIKVDVTTSGFSGNVTPDKDATISNSQENLQVNMPAGAVSEPVSCSIESATVDTPTIKGSITVSGPFQILCKKADNTILTGFNKPVTVQWTVVPPKNISGALSYYGYDGNWDKLTIKSHDTKAHTDTFSLDKGTTFVALGKLKTTPLFVKLLLVFGGLSMITGVVVFILLRRKRALEQAIMDDYKHKMTGV